MPRADASRQRCGRLEQEFTSLAAQREAFIRSQRNDLSGMRDAAALARCTLAALIAPQNDPPNGPDLIAWQQFVLVSLGKRVLDIAVGGASNLHGNIGRHDAAFESVIPCDMVRRDIIVLAASAGGLDALRGIVRMLPIRFPAALFVVQHIGPNSSILPTLLSQTGPLPASYPAHGQGIMPGHIYVAPPDHHMRLTPGLIHLDTGPKIHFTRPAADPLFQSAALAYGTRVVGVVLSGGDGDGAAGLRDVKARGGISIVQEPNQAENPGMPLQAIKEDAPDYCLRIAEIGPAFGAAQLPQGHAVNVIFSNPSWCLEFVSPNFLRPSNTPLYRCSASYRQSSTC